MAALLGGCTVVAPSGTPGSPSAGPPASQRIETDGATPTVPAPPDLSTRPLIWFAPLPPMPTGPGRPYTGSDDFLALFDAGAGWQAAAGHVRVFKLYGEWVAYHASASELRAAVEGIVSRGLALAVEMGPLDPPADCGAGVESFAGLDEAARISDRLRLAGATLQVIALDEPWYFAHVYSGAGACRWRTDQVAMAVADFTRAMRKAWPGVVVGDTEPTPAPVDAAGLAAWLAAYRAAAGEGFGFVHLDIDWSRPDWAAMARDVAEAAAEAGVPFGVIYNGGAATSDAAWLRLAGQRVLDYATDTSDPDHVIFQSWMDKPDRVLPETDPLTFTALIDRYAGARDTLGDPLGAGPVSVIPATARASASIGGSPAANATDGIADTIWSSGGGPPAWIELDLGKAIEIDSIRLLVAQSPPGRTDHRVTCRPTASADFVALGRLAGSTSDLDELTLRLPSPVACRIVRIRTVASPSWVAWREIEVYPAR
jgi:hypothetical protein